eukprot:m.67561 g.67561  ORF g.67561 m.67561 type:complete len:487 (-) comp13836_c0_seq1:73-1533(-)
MAKKKSGKKKSGKKKSGKKSASKSAAAEGETLDGLTREEIEGQVMRLKDELEREREERNFFQLERDKINTFWDISKRQLDETKADLRNRDREIEEVEERHAVEIKVYKQKVKHLLYEHQNQITELKADSAVSKKLGQDSHRHAEGDLRRDKRALKVELKEVELSNEDIVKSIQVEYDKQITKLREEMQRTSRELQQKYDHKAQALREDLDLQRKTEIHEIEERKNGQIAALIRNHERAFGDIKNYYNDITLNNLALINSLKEQVEDMKKKGERDEKVLSETLAENKRLVEPLQKARAKVEEMTKQLASHNKDKESLRTSKIRLKSQDEDIRRLKWEHEVLEQRFIQVEAERDELYDRFVSTIQDVQQKTGFKNLLLEKKLNTLSDVLEKKEAQLNEVLAASNLDPTALSVVTRKLEDVLDSKNAAIKDLQYELARVCKAHNDMVKTYEAKLSEFGIPVEELGFQPISANPGQPLGKGPAGLVAAPT